MHVLLLYPLEGEQLACAVLAVAILAKAGQTESSCSPHVTSVGAFLCNHFLTMSLSNLLYRFNEISIGNTPIERFRCLEPGPGIEIYAKREWQQFGGSVKSRPAYGIIRGALASGAWKPGQHLFDATSGNTGIAYAEICSRVGIPLKLFLPANATHERKERLRLLGADVTLTSPLEGTDGAQAAARDWLETHPNEGVYLDQYSNKENWHAHFDSTGPEILAQTQGQITHFLAGLGTTGTFTGVARYLQAWSEREGRKQVECIALQPATSLHGLEGWKHLETAHVPAIYDGQLPDKIQRVSTEAAYDMIRRIRRDHGMCLSPSGAANLAGTLAFAESHGRGVYVTVLPDDHTKYSALYNHLNIQHT